MPGPGWTRSRPPPLAARRHGDDLAAITTDDAFDLARPELQRAALLIEILVCVVVRAHAADHVREDALCDVRAHHLGQVRPAVAPEIVCRPPHGPQLLLCVAPVLLVRLWICRELDEPLDLLPVRQRDLIAPFERDALEPEEHGQVEPALPLRQTAERRLAAIE